MTDFANASEASDQGGATSDYMQGIESEISNTREEALQARREAAHLSQTVGKIRQAFVPAEQPRGDEWYDQILDQLMEAEKAGKSMPMTGVIAQQVAALQKKSMNESQEIAQLRAIVEKLKNPSVVADQRAYANMDDQIITTLEDMYGEDVPPAFAEAVSSEIENVLRVIQAEAPDKWKKIGRSESMQRKLVLHCAQKLVPPKARETMVSQYEQERPTTMQDFERGWAELATLEQMAKRGEANPREVAQMKTQLRQEWLEYKFNGEKRYNNRDNRR